MEGEGEVCIVGSSSHKLVFSLKDDERELIDRGNKKEVISSGRGGGIEDLKNGHYRRGVS